MPVGAIGGRGEIMQQVAPAGRVYQAGTLSGNPLAMTAGLVTIRELLKPGVFDAIAGRTAQLVDGIRTAAGEAGVPPPASPAGTMFGFYFLRDASAEIRDYASARQHADADRYARFFRAMLERGVYFAPSQFEAAFLSSAHRDEEIEHTLAAVREVLAAL